MFRLITEISCYMRNEPGVLARVVQEMAENKVTIKGLQANEGQMQSLVRLVVDNVDLADKILRESFGVELIANTEVLEMNVKHGEKHLAKLTSLLGQNEININCIYFSSAQAGTYVAYVSVSDPDLALKILSEELETSSS